MHNASIFFNLLNGVFNMNIMDKNKEIIDRLKNMCRERTREINRMYHGGFSSREQCNFDGQLEIMKEIMQMTDRRRKI